MSRVRVIDRFSKVLEVPGSMSSVRGTLVALALEGSLTDRGDEPPIDGLPGMRRLLESRPRYRWAPQPPDHDLSGRRGWRICRLGETGLYVNGVAFKPIDWGHSGRPIIRIQNLSGVAAEHHFTDREVDADNLIHDGDLLVSWSATLDTFIWSGPEAVLNQHIFKVIPNLTAVRPRFLFWLLKHEVKQLADSQHAHGLAMMHINRGPFLGHTIALPPLAEQERIVAKIDDLMRLCDELEAAKAQRDKTRDQLRAASLARLTVLKDTPGTVAHQDVNFFLSYSDRMVTKPDHVADLRRAVFDLAVQHKLVPSPDAPVVGTLEDLCEKITDGTHRTPTYVSSGVRFVSVKDFSAGKLDLSNTRYITAEEHAELTKRCDPRRGDVLIGRIGTLGKAVIVDTDTPFSLFVSVGLLRPILERCLPEYMALYLNSPTAEAQYDQIKVGGGTHTNKLNLGDLRRLEMSVPSIETQETILARVCELSAVCDELEQALRSAEEGRAKLLEAVLHEVLHGRAIGVELPEATA